MYILGFDIGGTKCAVVTALWDGNQIKLLKKEKCATDHSISPREMINNLIELSDSILEKSPDFIGVSCGGPLDSEKGIILNPPNLPKWINVNIVSQINQHYKVPVQLQNDANACAVAEWMFGNGKGYKNVIFLTFGTGLGAGLILNGKLYNGTNGNAGEIGHIRLDSSGPVGFGKEGSFEGFCSGGGIAQLGYLKALEAMKKGVCPSYFKDGMKLQDVTAKSIAEAAMSGDKTALDTYKTSGKYLGKGLSIIIDILNPDAIIIGSIFTRNKNLLWDATKMEIEKEALQPSVDCCKILPAMLGENIGDYAAVATALLGVDIV